jgi:diguanylate cyclase (GGDEF)-like protein/PAS domain S-box-containing protein
MADLRHLASSADRSRRWFAGAEASGSRPSDAAVLTRVLAYLQLAGVGLVAMWLVVPPVGHVNGSVMIVAALIGAAFAAALLRTPVHVHSSRLATMSALSTALLGAYTASAGEAAAPFSMLYLVAVGAAVWCLSSRQALVQIGWVAATFGLGTWLYRLPGEASWPHVSSDDLKNVLVWGGALCVVALLIKMFKRAIVDRDQRLAAIVDSSQDAILGKNRDGVITVWNRGAERLYGYTASEAIGRSVSVLIPAGHFGEGPELLRRVLANERIEHQTERVCKDGSIVNVSVSISPIHGRDGAVVGASSIARDITSAMRGQREIALQAELLDEVDAAVMATDSTFVVRYWNRGAEELYGYAAADAIGQAVVDLIVPDDGRATVTKLGGNALAGRPAEAELDARNEHGRVFPINLRLRAAQLGASDVAFTGVIGISVDISARRKAEQEIRRNAAQQEEIANLGRLALQGDSLAELFDHAVRIASRVLSAECARVVECVPDGSGLVVRAGVGWLDGRKGERVAGEPPLLSSFAAVALEPVVVQDWDLERRFERSSRLRARGVRASVAVPIGDPRGSPFGVLEVHYTQPETVPADCGPFLGALANVLAEAIHSRDANEMIRVQALHDGLTGLPNRTLFHDRVTHALARNDRRRKRLAVFLIDLDRFKLVNDSLGHDAGDELLRLLAVRLAGALREGDTLARLGGDQFAVLWEELPSEVAAVGVANQLMSLVKQPVLLRGEKRVLSVSVGIALSSGESTATELLRDVDAALYHAKKAGGRRFELFDNDMRDRVLGRVRTESALRTALANEQEIYVHYQPLVSLRTGRIVGAEALARWSHPDWGQVPPSEFIPVAEDSGLIHGLSAKVIRRAVLESAAWQHVPDFAGISVNVSTRQLVESDEVPTLLRESLFAADITPGFLTVEVTESVLIEQLDAACAALRSLRDLGVQLALDDFGTGYSSLSYLRDLPLDIVKIDRSMITGIVDTPRAADIPAAIVQMAHSLDLKVIAEGVETIDQAARLQRLSCDIAQGFYFGKPMSPEDLTELLHNQPDWPPPTAKQTVSAPNRRLAHKAGLPARDGRKPSSPAVLARGLCDPDPLPLGTK